jgi:hypothetical protein
MQLTHIEYGVIMQAIENAYAEIAENNFIDPYNNEEKVTNEEVFNALKSVEKKIHAEFTQARI